MVAALDQLLDRRLIAVENGSWQMTMPLETVQLEAPESLRQTTKQRRALEVASVSGMSFTTNVNAQGRNVSSMAHVNWPPSALVSRNENPVNHEKALDGNTELRNTSAPSFELYGLANHVLQPDIASL